MAETQQNAQSLNRASRKTRVGVVVSDKMDKTVVVSIERRVQHPVYGKMVRRTKRRRKDRRHCADHGDPSLVEGQAVASGRDRRSRALTSSTLKY